MTETDLLSNLISMVNLVKKEKTIIGINSLSKKETDTIQLINNLKTLLQSSKANEPIKTIDPQTNSTEQTNAFINVLSSIKQELAKHIGIPEDALFEIQKYSFLEGQSLLASISRDQSENTHSDFIAPIFRSNFIGLQFASSNYLQILEAADIPLPKRKQIVSIEAHREFRLDSLSLNPECCDRRIDILIIVTFKDNSEEYLAIENKIFAKESDDQTTSYSAALSAKVRESNGRIDRFSGLLLSPYCCVPKSKDFRPIGYSDLFKVILSSRNKATSAIAIKYSNFYLFELSSTILKRLWLFNKSEKG